MQSDKNIAGVSEKNKSTYKEIFSSSLIVGGTQFITLFFNLIRAKVLAVVLGAGGTGIIGLYTSTALFINSLFGLGIRSSAVRQVAVAAANNDDYYVKKTVKTLRITVVITSLVAALLVILFSERLSELTFDNKEHIGGIMALSIVVLLSGISDGQFALLQGLRKIKDLAKSKIAGAVLSSIIGIILILVFNPIFNFRLNVSIELKAVVKHFKTDDQVRFI